MQLPTTRGQLWRLPLLGAVLGAGLGAALGPLFGAGAALAVGGAASLLLAGALARLAWHGQFGPRSWLVGAALLGTLLAAGVLLLGSCAALWTQSPARGRTVAGLGLLVLATAALAGAWSERRRLAGGQGPWWTAVVDVARQRVGSPFEVAPAGHSGERLGVLAAAVGANVPLALELAGYRTTQWLPWVLAAFGAALLYVAWQGLGPLVARALAVLALEAQTGQRFRHRDLEQLEALRRGSPPPGEPAADAPRALRLLRGTLQALTGIGVVGGATLAFAFAWPDWQQARDWSGFQRVTVRVTAVDVTPQRGDWVGQGTVDGLPVDFRPRELEALLGRAPATRQAALALAVPRLPLQAEAWWNPRLAQRLLPPQATEASAQAQARYSAGFVLACLALAFAAWLADRALSRRAVQTPQPKRRRGGRRSDG